MNTDTEMGAKVSRATQTQVAEEPKKFTIPALINTRYILTFTGSVYRLSQHKDVRKKHVKEAREELLKESTWLEYLQWTMRDALVNHFERETGQQIYCGANDKGPVQNLQIVLDAPYKKSPFDDTNHHRISGKVIWESIETDGPSFDAAVQWRIGDRMAYHGVQTDSWYFTLVPKGTVREKLP